MAIQIVLAFVLDLLIGDPRVLPHPVVMIGGAITWLEGWLRRFGRKPWQERLAGVVLTGLVVSGTYWLAFTLLCLANQLHPWLGWGLSLWLLATTLATKSLAQAGLNIYQPLVAGDLERARKCLSWVVGRDTVDLPPEEIVRGAVETVAENTADGVIAPIFYACLGGAPLALAYKAVNTLDSMVGYRNERYRYFGWASARLDDLANLIPARLTAALLTIAAWICGQDGREAWRLTWRDARRHPSPNSGYPEAAVAGALGIRLGGWNSYGGVPSFRPYLGDPRRPIVPSDILAAVSMMRVAAWLGVAMGAAWCWWVN